MRDHLRKVGKPSTRVDENEVSGEQAELRGPPVRSRLDLRGTEHIVRQGKGNGHQPQEQHIVGSPHVQLAIHLLQPERIATGDRVVEQVATEQEPGQGGERQGAVDDHQGGPESKQPAANHRLAARAGNQRLKQL